MNNDWNSRRLLHEIEFLGTFDNGKNLTAWGSKRKIENSEANLLDLDPKVAQAKIDVSCNTHNRYSLYIVSRADYYGLYNTFNNESVQTLRECFMFFDIHEPKSQNAQ